MAIEIPASLRERFEKQARELYGEEGEAAALAQAIELWLAEARADAIRLARALNNQVYEELRPDLEAQHWGEWVIIARGKLQGSSLNLDDVKTLALDAGHRLVVRIGDEPPPRTRNLGWSS